MGWFILSHIFSTILSLIQVSRLSDKDKDLEVIILRHQLAVMTRLHAKPVTLFLHENVQTEGVSTHYATHLSKNRPQKAKYSSLFNIYVTIEKKFI